MIESAPLFVFYILFKVEKRKNKGWFSCVNYLIGYLL